jgi:hypothetical protein
VELNGLSVVSNDLIKASIITFDQLRTIVRRIAAAVAADYSLSLHHLQPTFSASLIHLSSTNNPTSYHWRGSNIQTITQSVNQTMHLLICVFVCAFHAFPPKLVSNSYVTFIQINLAVKRSVYSSIGSKLQLKPT